MTREEIIRQIVHREVEQLGMTEDVVRQDAPGLHVSACEQFGTWETALKYAGVHVQRGQPDTREHVIQRLRKLCVAGNSLESVRNMRRDRRLYEAARHHFGSWKKALQAAGINLEHAFLRRPRKHDKQKILAEIVERQAKGSSLVWTEVCLENRALATAAKQAFGSWGKTLIAAGIDHTLHRVREEKSQ